MADSTAQAVLAECQSVFIDYARHHLAKDPPDLAKAARNLGMAALCAEALEPPTDDQPTAEPGVRIATIDLNDFVYNAANGQTHTQQQRAWLENQLAERGFRYCVPLSDLGARVGPMTDSDLYGRRVINASKGQFGTVTQFTERTDNGS